MWPRYWCNTEQIPCKKFFVNTQCSESGWVCLRHAKCDTYIMLIQSFKLKSIQWTRYQEYVENVAYWGIMCIAKRTWNVWSLFYRQNNFIFFLWGRNAMSVRVVESWLLTHVVLLYRFKNLCCAFSYIATPHQKAGYREMAEVLYGGGKTDIALYKTPQTN